MTLVSYTARCCKKMPCSRKYTQQHKMADESHAEFEFNDKNEEIGCYIDVSKGYFLIIGSRKIPFQ